MAQVPTGITRSVLDPSAWLDLRVTEGFLGDVWGWREPVPLRRSMLPGEPQDNMAVWGLFLASASLRNQQICMFCPLGGRSSLTSLPWALLGAGCGYSLSPAARGSWAPHPASHQLMWQRHGDRATL